MSSSCANSANEIILNSLKKWEKQCRHTRRHKMSFTYKRAIKSVKIYPLPLTNVKECLKLAGIGQYIANQIEDNIFDSGPLSNIPKSISSSSSFSNNINGGFIIGSFFGNV